MTGKRIQIILPVIFIFLKMILCSAFLSDELIKNLPEEVQPAMLWLGKFAKNMEFNIKSLGKLPARIDIDGDNIYANVDSELVVPKDMRKLEIHKKYIDIHVPITGEEIIGILKKEKLRKTVSDYNEGKDIAFYDDEPSEYTKLEPTQVAIIYPNEAHAPLCGDELSTIIKMCIKIKIK